MDDSEQDFSLLCSRLLKRVRRKGGDSGDEKKTVVSSEGGEGDSGSRSQCRSKAPCKRKREKKGGKSTDRIHTDGLQNGGTAGGGEQKVTMQFLSFCTMLYGLFSGSGAPSVSSSTSSHLFHMGFLWVRWFSPATQKHADRSIGVTESLAHDSELSCAAYRILKTELTQAALICRSRKRGRRIRCSVGCSSLRDRLRLASCTPWKRPVPNLPYGQLRPRFLCEVTSHQHPA